MSKPKLFDLNLKKYSKRVLKENIYALDLITILNTQIINEKFAVNYILNKNFQLTEEEENITIEYVLEKQPHLDKNKLFRLHIMGPDDCEYPNFQKFADVSK